VIRALSTLDDCLCDSEKCSGDHGVFWIAGGGPAFLTGKTKTFNDFDVFVSCDGPFRDVTTDSLHSYTSDLYTVTCSPSKFVVSILAPNTVTIQIIRVPGFHTSLGVQPCDRRAPYFRDLFGLYVLFTFDLPVCRVGITCPLRPFDVLYGFTILDLTLFSYTRCPNENRVKKYLDRVCQNVTSLEISNYVKGMLTKMVEVETASSSVTSLSDIFSQNLHL
jgi:hypothetical protein